LPVFFTIVIPESIRVLGLESYFKYMSMK